MTLKQRSDSRYEGRVTINNKRKSFYGNTKAEVKNKAKEYLNKVENGYKEPTKIKLNEYIEYWLQTYKLNKIEPSSYTKLLQVYECQIKDGIGLRNIGEITTRDVQKIIDDHANPPFRSGIKPLAMSGLKRIIHLLNPCFKQAVKEGVIQNNPCEDVIIPKESCIQVETKQQFSLNDSQIQRFKEEALRKNGNNNYKNRDGIILLLILGLGLRVGEAYVKIRLKLEQTQ